MSRRRSERYSEDLRADGEHALQAGSVLKVDVQPAGSGEDALHDGAGECPRML